MMNHCTYIVESETNTQWYYGHTEDIENRLFQHNTGRNKSTKGKGPWKLIFKREFQTKLEANRFELKLKSLRNKEYIRREYKEYFL